MSWHLLSEVYKRKIGSAPRKAVLAYCADKANDDGTGIFASKATIAKATELGRSTVIRVISELVDEGVLIPVGHRKCANGATVDYTLIKVRLAAFPALDDGEDGGKGSQSGTSPDRDQSQSGTPPVPGRDPKASQSGTQTTLEPPLNGITPISPKRDEVFGLLCRLASPEAAASFIAYRKRHKSKALTVTAAKRLAASLQIILNAGHDPSDALGLAEERGWASVQPHWYFNSLEEGDRHDNRARNSGPQQRGSGGHGSGTVDAFAAVARQRAQGGA